MLCLIGDRTRSGYVKQCGPEYAPRKTRRSKCMQYSTVALQSHDDDRVDYDVDGESDNTGSSKLKVRNTDTSRSNNDTTRKRVIRQLQRVLDRVNSEKRHMTRIV